jgi:hypothetical protein
MAIPKKEFSACFEKWKERWDKCVWSQGKYFEGDYGTIVLCLNFFNINWLDTFGTDSLYAKCPLFLSDFNES